MSRRLSKLKRKRITSRKTWSHYASYALLIGPSAFIVSFMGILSFKLKSSKFVFWKLHFVYATILIIVFTAVTIYSAYVLNLTYKFRDEANKWHSNILIFVGLINLFISYANNRSMIKAIQRVSDISRVVPPKIFCKLTKIVLMKDLILVTPLFSFIAILISYFNILAFYLIWCMFTGIFALINLYTNNVYILSACFQQINESLEKVKEILINDEPHLLRRVFHSRKNPMLLSMLRHQKKQYLETSKIVHELNDAFSMQMETSLFLLLIDTTFNIYSYLAVYSDEGMVKQFGYDIMFGVLNVILVIFITLVVDIARNEMAKIGWNIHRILIHTSDDKVTTELEMFSLQVLQRGNTFMINGLVLDLTYLTQIASGISTLLLIVIQFSISKSC
ncbi:PREDICTED: uncharacterized protein LOC108545735 [Eufriesea mexicana]|uniref:uncharacterized protein LOC108545735 n=1 Tax=Eufriesea mexicana TaxID=516756 RepID=UPI00083C0B8F|nr:PREDICTED: uncharacterized protein LOC108545735 [Eufriesea mexicana]